MDWILADQHTPQTKATYPVNFITMSVCNGKQAYNGPHVGFYRETRKGQHIFEDTDDNVYIGVTHWARIESPPFDKEVLSALNEMTTETPALSATLLPYAIGDAEDGGLDYADYAKRLRDSAPVGQLGEAINEVADRMCEIKAQHDTGES